MSKRRDFLSKRRDSLSKRRDSLSTKSSLEPVACDSVVTPSHWQKPSQVKPSLRAVVIVIVGIMIENFEIEKHIVIDCA